MDKPIREGLIGLGRAGRAPDLHAHEDILHEAMTESLLMKGEQHD